MHIWHIWSYLAYLSSPNMVKWDVPEKIHNIAPKYAYLSYLAIFGNIWHIWARIWQLLCITSPPPTKILWKKRRICTIYRGLVLTSFPNPAVANIQNHEHATLPLKHYPNNFHPYINTSWQPTLIKDSGHRAYTSSSYDSMQCLSLTTSGFFSDLIKLKKSGSFSNTQFSRLSNWRGMLIIETWQQQKSNIWSYIW